MLQVTNVSKEFRSGSQRVAALDDISFSVAAGAFVAIIGKSGSGKSTLLSLLGALDHPSHGSMMVNGEDITKLSDRQLITYRRKDVGFVFQQYNLIPNLSALDNVMLPMEFAGVPKLLRQKRAAALLSQVGLGKIEQRRKPAQLSGGEQQRVAIARALANRPKLILADEPTGNLDTQTSKYIVELLRTLSRSENTTIIIVTHDLAVANNTDKVFDMQDGRLMPHHMHN